jgi:hypothetical protein
MLCLTTVPAVLVVMVVLVDGIPVTMNPMMEGKNGPSCHGKIKIVFLFNLFFFSFFDLVQIVS